LIKTDQYGLSILPKDKEANWEVAKELVEKLPHSVFSHSNLAVVSASLAVGSSPERAAKLRADAKGEAQRALALDPSDASAHFALSFLFPSVGHWKEREQFLLQGLAVSPQSGLLTNIESNFLREVGRLQDAVAYGRQAQAPLPQSANRDATLVLALAVTSNNFEATPLAETAAKSWPSHPAIWNARFEVALFKAQWVDALALLTRGGYLPLPDAVADAWRSALSAAKSGDPSAKREAVQDLVAQLNPALPWASAGSTPPNEMMTPGALIGMLGLLGDRDAAFTQAQAYLKHDSFTDSSFLFWPDLAEWRRDPRFLQLVTQVGLVDYWRNSGKWPDFCTDPALPYRCSSR
jgi:tetratricopeptide (TPR) repeat protein